MNKERKPKSWDIALVGADASRSFILYAVSQGLCTTRAQCQSNFVESDRMWELVQELTELGFLKSAVDSVTLADAGILLVQSFRVQPSAKELPVSKLRPSGVVAGTERDGRLSGPASDPRGSGSFRAGDSRGDGVLVGAGTGRGKSSTSLGGTPNSVPQYMLALFDYPLLPEMFNLVARRAIKHHNYSCEAWLMPGSHVLRFEARSVFATELLGDDRCVENIGRPRRQCRCNGEQDVEHSFADSGINYLSSIQTEILNENLFVSTVKEMEAYASEAGAVAHDWEDDAGKCLSLIDMQMHEREAHVQSYHLLAQHGLVVRAQSIFEIC